MQLYKRWVIIVAALFLVVAAGLTNQASLYYMAALIVSLPIASYIVGMFALRNIEFARETPVRAWDGEAVEFRIVARSHARLPRLFIEAQDHLPEWLTPEDPEPPLFNVLPNTTTRTAYRVQLHKRGAYRLEWLTVTALDPLGIFAFSKRVRAESEILVFPVPEAVPDIVLSGAERYGFRDLPIAAARGTGVDPDGVREYVPGDPLRRMHWKSVARTGKLSVIEFEESRAVNVVLALELFRGAYAGAGKESTLEYLVRMAASLAQAAVRQGASVRLIAGPDGESVPTGRGGEHLYAILAALARAELVDAEPLSSDLLGRVGSLQPGTTLIVLTSGLDRDLPGALQHYTAYGAQVVVVYADPRSFDTGARLPTRDAQRALAEELLAAQAVPFVLARNAESALRPETTQDGGYFE